LKPDLCCIRVESVEPYGWIVYCADAPVTHFFVGRTLALSLARLWADAHAPSKIQLADLSGRVTDEWIYEARSPDSR
jgi:hypothetical protein